MSDSNVISSGSDNHLLSTQSEIVHFVLHVCELFLSVGKQKAPLRAVWRHKARQELYLACTHYNNTPGDDKVLIFRTACVVNYQNVEAISDILLRLFFILGNFIYLSSQMIHTLYLLSLCFFTADVFG